MAVGARFMAVADRLMAVGARFMAVVVPLCACHGLPDTLL